MQWEKQSYIFKVEMTQAPPPPHHQCELYDLPSNIIGRRQTDHITSLADDKLTI